MRLFLLLALPLLHAPTTLHGVTASLSPLVLFGCATALAAEPGEDAGSRLPGLTLSALQFGTAHVQLAHRLAGVERQHRFAPMPQSD